MDVPTITDVTQGRPDAAQLARQGYAKLSFGSDDQLGVRFFTNAVEVPALGTIEDREFIEIAKPGGDTFVTELTKDHPYKQRFAEKYAAWKAGQTEPVGTPLSRLPFIKSPALIKQLAAFDIETAEQLAAIDDLVVQKIGMGGLDLRQKAQTYLQLASDTEFVRVQQEERSALREQTEALQRANDELRAEMEAMKEMLMKDNDGKEQKKGRP